MAVAIAADLMLYSEHHDFPGIKGMKGDPGPRGPPGNCPVSVCSSNNCNFGARDVLKQVQAQLASREPADEGDEGTALLMNAWRATVERGNNMARLLENGSLSVESITEEEANNVFNFLFLRNRRCNGGFNLFGGPDSNTRYS